MRTYKEKHEDMILRDFLALDRTILANTRTLLAYMRTAIGLIAGGIGMVKLVADGLTHIIGYIFIIAAFPTLIIGIYEYIKMKKALLEIEQEKKKKTIKRAQLAGHYFNWK